MKFLENEIRAVRGAKLYSFEYWVHTEVLIDGKWVTPYLVDEEKLNWYETDVKLNPTEKNMKEYLSNQLWVINDCLERGYNETVAKVVCPQCGKQFYDDPEEIKPETPSFDDWPKVTNCPRNCKKCQAKCLYRKEPFSSED